MKRNHRRQAWFFSFLVLFALPVLPGATVFAETLAIPGSGACEPLLAELAAAFNNRNPQDRIEIPPSVGSGGGIDAVLRDQAPLARVARRLKDTEERQGLVRMVFARDAVVFAVGRQLKVANLRAEQLAGIFSGRIENWRELGAPEGKIRVVIREPGDASLTVLRENLPAFRELIFSPLAKVCLYDRDAVKVLDNYRNAIGFVTASALKWSRGNIRPLALNGVTPVKANLQSGKYPLLVEYALIYKQKPASVAERFVQFLFSEQGRKIIEKSGMVALEGR
ncbi:MAG: substrate-binding domain-containing protein [Deltaproteobacteria bacterium]|nr:substrate-binding domain-containing protein [Deltaproteobacteria bacterium]